MKDKEWTVNQKALAGLITILMAGLLISGLFFIFSLAPIIANILGFITLTVLLLELLKIIGQLTLDTGVWIGVWKK